MEKVEKEAASFKDDLDEISPDFTSVVSAEEVPGEKQEVVRPSALTELDTNRTLPVKSTPSSPTQKMLYDEIAALRRERDEALSEKEKAEARLNAIRLSSNTVADNDQKCQFYTGLTWAIFVTTFHHLALCVKSKGVPMVPLIDQFFYMLVKLRQAPKFEHLADQTGVPESTLVDHFWKWIDIAYVKLKFLIAWPEREYVFRVIPPAMKNLYPRLTGIIDCFEIFIEAPSNLKARAQCWSNYKKHTTVKFLIACNSTGAITFLSKAWGGRVSDVEIVTKSGLLTDVPHHPGDQILADRGFTMEQEFAGIAGVELLTPAFIKGKEQFTPQDVETSRMLSSIRIHIERVIGLLKNRFSILKGPLSLKFVKSIKDENDEVDMTHIDKVVTVCAILTNLGGGIVYKE